MRVLLWAGRVAARVAKCSCWPREAGRLGVASLGSCSLQRLVRGRGSPLSREGCMLAGMLAQMEPGSSEAFSAMSSRAGGRGRFLEEALALEAGSSCQNTRRAA